MAHAGAGWFDDGSGELRWWDGVQWTSYYFDGATGAVVDRGAAQSKPFVTTAAKREASGLNVKAAVITLSVIVVVILIAWGPAALLLAAGLGAGAVGLYAVLKGSLARLRIRRRSVAVAVLAAGVLVASLGGVALAASNSPRQDVGTFAGTDPEPTRKASSTPTSTPTPTPVRKETIVEERAPIAF
jgi:hypothetical protein